MHFSRSSEVLYFHTDVVSVHTDSHTDLKRHVVASWAIYTEYKASRQAESRMYRCRGREKRSQKEKSTRNSIKIGEICIVPRNVGKRRDVVERLRGNRNLSMKEEGRVGKPDGGRTWRSRVKRETQKNEGRAISVSLDEDCSIILGKISSLNSSRRLLRSGRAGNWRLLLLLLADPILSWYIVACCTNVMRNYESCTQEIIIKCKRDFYFSLHIDRPRIMAEKTWLTAKLCRGLSWNCQEIEPNAKKQQDIHDDISNGSNGNCFRTRNSALRALSLGIV
ncbi:hypothetical protein ALC60_12634 [Trachymyrmex zeteki]|uniref:Uncharacterized protein n=1 Tax=Mycetomoellerius zeteki TaxID=64791 RepID=A0A151WKE4_9HYME|nr:hypothetical protein ALC60_12634 [Trachymyrmex zeteki]